MPQAPKDCRTCNRRRIRCDRAVPACSKCVARGLSCPGYEKQLRWVCGAVSKGPYRQDFHQTDVKLRIANGTQHAEDRWQRTMDTEWVESYSCTSLPPEHYPFALFRTSMVEAQLCQPGADALLNHFTEVVANQLAWYDDDANPWRNLIIPLAMSSHTLFTAILAMASGNIVSRTQRDHGLAEAYLQSMQLHRNNALRLLSEDFRAMSNLIPSGSCLLSHSHWAKATLASVIILSYLEVHFPMSDVWRLHLKAARQVLQVIGRPSMFDRTINFLAEELFAAITWSLLTDYDSDASIGKDDLDMSISKDSLEHQEALEMVAMPLEESGFAGFCLALRRITVMERLFQQSKIQQVPCMDVEATLRQIDLLLSEARCRALKAVRPECLRNSKTEGLDAQHLIDALYHATSIYKFRALRCITKEDPTMISYRSQLFESLLAFHDPESFAQDQTWPLFVAGTESKGDAASQDWIRCRFQRIMRCSCALDRPRVLSFLEAFWLQTVCENWIDYGRQWASHVRFLIL